MILMFKPKYDPYVQIIQSVTGWYSFYWEQIVEGKGYGGGERGSYEAMD